MKTWTKRIASICSGTALMFGIVSFSCSKNTAAPSVAFADTQPPSVSHPNSLAAVESLQNVFRNVSDTVLPSVVELDVVETKTRPANPFEDIPFFFFGQPDKSDKNGNERQREYKQAGLGSGVIVRRSGSTYYVLTNNHVAGSATEISVKLSEDRKYTGKLVGSDERRDIALVSFQSEVELPVAKLGDSDSVKTGDICFAMGTPLGYFKSVTQGIISATGRAGTGIGNISDFIQTDAAINQGNSGGPLVNIYGEVIGINTWIASQSGGSQGLGFAIPVNNIKRAIESFIESGKVTYGWMGVSLIEISDEYAQELGVGKTAGAFVAHLFLNSPAEKGGIRCGDYITVLNGKKVKSVDQLVRDVGDFTVGEKAVFEVLRGGKTVSVTVKIEGRSKDVANDNSKLWPGFIAAPITDEVRKELSLDKKIKGAVAMNVLPKSPAAALRLQNGDIITAVNDKPVSSIAEFYAALAENGKNEVWFDVYNDGHTISTAHYKFR
ncbi:MAG: DegQ family serine endoprotease [Bacteroides sp.]|nr:DegQ family serine endoprotease [Prevotella sp.]MCM1406968.1 DegQ family serine endoprotease [Treponema brennaborense]MCM1470119.1 DegQ family serine endoprotease [Bacteroides sp.]